MDEPFHVTQFRLYRDRVPPDPWEAAMPIAEEEVHRCQHNGCPAIAPKHSWSSETKNGRGWFHKRNGDSWCPEHLPAWVDEWRARQG